MLQYYIKNEGILYTLIAIVIIIVALLGLASLYSVFKFKIQFFINGLDAGFSIPDINLLWNVAQICELDQPTSLFYSLPSLTKCMSQITNQAAAEGTENSPKTQLLLSKLYNYRTKIQNETDDKKGLTSTQYLEKGQTLRIILPGKGVFVSEIVSNANQLVINVPKQKNMIIVPGEEWVGKVVSVYLWRKGDARYVFDTTVTQHGLFLGKSALFLKHSANLVRTQKRKSVRAKCQIYGNLFFVKGEHSDDNTTIETKDGYRCLLEDISESGALIRIGGKGAANVKIKLQFSIKNKLIIMLGTIKTVEFNESENQSLLHFECTKIDPLMRNEILAFVYNMLPESEKEVLEALEQTENDENETDFSLDDDEKTSEAENNSENMGENESPATSGDFSDDLQENGDLQAQDSDLEEDIPTLEENIFEDE